MKKYFLSFADTSLRNSLNRIGQQARNMGCFDEIFIYSEKNLDQEFTLKYSKVLVKGSRGFGYWVWKPQIILQALSKLNEGDLLLYTDAGCHLNLQGRSRLLEYFQILNSDINGIIAFQAKLPEPPLTYDGREMLDLREFKWAKYDLIDFFGLDENSVHVNSQTIGATVILIKKCSKSIEIIKKWIDIISSDFSLLDDSPSKLQNLDGFIEHRHDQSIFSILCKLNGINTLSAYEYWYPNHSLTDSDWDLLKFFPVHARRDKRLSFWKRNKWQLIKRLIFNFLNK